MSSSTQNDSVSKAANHLTAALEKLTGKTGQLLAQLQAAKSGTIDNAQMDEDRARLAEELDQARTRAAVMEDAAREAGDALDAAIADVRTALENQTQTGGDAGS